jgi:uncharacterized membrane protein (UPF0127 family)
MSVTVPRARVASMVMMVWSLTAVAALFAQGADQPVDLATFPRTSLEITAHGAKGAPQHKYPFDVWVADTEPRAEQGLMFVRDLPESMGMVFPLEPPRIERMWMKNTYVELDMLFVGSDGRISKIIESSDTPVAAVVELKGGEAGKLGLKVGDNVSWQKPALH